MRTIGAVTVGRSDYGIYLPILRRIMAEPSLRLHLIVSGTHLSTSHGRTIEAIHADGIPIGDEVPLPYTSDDPQGIARTMGAAVEAFARAFARGAPDILLVLGDRYEMHAAALAALPFKIPVAHIHGGEITYGAIDDALRHSITKLSHLHFVSTREHAARVMQLGEPAERVVVSGAPALDNLRALRLTPPEELSARLGVPFKPRPLLVTFHPVSLEYEQTSAHAEELFVTLARVDRPIIITMPNADTRNREIREAVAAFVAAHPNARAFESLGTQTYFSLMACAAAMVGNSSSGIIEAASFGLPVVNIGLRQAGRVRPANVIDVEPGSHDIMRGIERALSPGFREALQGATNPYGTGDAATVIVRTLMTVRTGPGLVMKRFVDRGLASPAPEGPAAVVIGGGGHARVVVDTLRASGAAKPIAIVDADASLRGTSILGVPVVGGDEEIAALAGQGVRHFVMGVGSIKSATARERLFEKAAKIGLSPVTVIHPSAIVSPHARLGAGSQIMAGVIVQAGASVGLNVIVNTAAIIEHDCVLGDHVHIATGAKLAGGVSVGRGGFVGAGAVIRQGVNVGAGAIVGAGSVVVADVSANTTVMGVPAKERAT